MSNRPELIVYSRRGCHLCEVLLEELEPMVRSRARILVRDVDRQADWLAEYGERVPVVCADGAELCHYHLDRTSVRNWLSAATPPA